MAQAFHENFLSAKAMVQQSMEAPTKTVKYLPMFLRVFPQAQVDKYKQTHNSVVGSTRLQYCMNACKDQDSECLDQCKTFYDSAMEEGLNLIRKVHKPYKLQVLQDDE